MNRDQDNSGVIIDEDVLSAVVFGKEMSAEDPTTLYVKIIEQILEVNPG